MADRLPLPVPAAVTPTPVTTTVQPPAIPVTVTPAPLEVTVTPTPQSVDLPLGFLATTGSDGLDALALTLGERTLALVRPALTAPGWVVTVDGVSHMLTQDDPAPDPDPTPEPEPVAGVLRADAFVDHVAINIHPNFSGVWAGAEWRENLLALKARYWRGSIGTLTRARDAVEDLWQRGGMQGIALVGGSFSPVYSADMVKRNLNALATWGGHKVAAVEGPNEANKDPVAGWADMVRATQKAIWETVLSDSRLAGVTVLGPSVYRRIAADFAALGDLSPWVDAPVLHSYPGGEPPSVGEWDRGKLLPVEDLLAIAQKTGASADPVWVTETNYSNADTGIAPSSFHLPPDLAAVYMLRMLFLFLKLGVGKTALYALTDQASGASNYGLMALGQDGVTLTRRPMFHALQRALSHMADPGAPAPLVDLGLGLEGDLQGVEHVLFQRRDGTYTLAIWQEARVWDRQALKAIDVPHRPITLRLPRTMTAMAYAPNLGPTGVNLGAGTAIPVPVPAHVLLVDLT